MAKGVTIGDKNFPLKKAADEHFRCIRNRYDLGGEIHRNDKEELLQLLKDHPVYEEKNGAGVAGFTVKIEKGGSRCFRNIQPEGTGEHFSWGKCIDAAAGKASV